MKFSEFNRETNPNDESCYIVKLSSGNTPLLKFTEVIKVVNTHPESEIYWRIPKGFFVLETKVKQLEEIIQNRNPRVFAYSTTDNLYIFCKGTFNRTTTYNLLACGVTANTFAYSKSGTIVLLPFRNKRISTNPIYKDINIVHSNSLGTCPKWLWPLRKITSPSPDGLDIPITSNAQTILSNHLNRLKGFNKFDQEDVLTLMNEEFCTSPLTKDEIKNLLEISEQYILNQFVDKGLFYHNKLGDYVIETCNIKKDIISGELYYFNDKKNIYVNDISYIMGYLTKLCPLLKQYQKEETIKYIQNYLYDEQVEFNHNEYSVVFKNGILNLVDMSFEQMTPDHLESIMINANYDPDAHSGTVDEFFSTATCGNKSIETLLYEAIGYSMLKTNALQKAFILVGSGRNGKSTYFDIIKAVLGRGNYASMSFKDLSSNFRASQLKGKLASLAGDISAQPIQETDLIKSISAGEEITLEEKYKQSYTDKVFATLFYGCNKLPRTPDTSDGFYRRFVIIPFLADLTKVSTVDGLQFHERLMEQESIDYVAYKAVHAIHHVFETTKEFTEPKEVIEMKKNYKIDNSTVLSWFKEVLKGDKSELEKRTINTAFLSYTNWCEEAGRGKQSKTTFVASVKADIGIELKEK